MMIYHPPRVRKCLVAGLLTLLLVQGSEVAKGQSLENISWRQTNGPEGGHATSLLAASDGSLFVGTLRGGVFRSVDGGQSWTNVGVQHTFDVEDLVESPQGTLIAGTGEGIHRSTDGGHTWSLVEETMVQGPSLSATIAVDPNGWILSGSRIGLYRSKDDGLSWEVERWESVVELEAAPSGQLFMMAVGAIYLYDEDRDTWVEISTSVEGQPNWRAMAVLDSSTVFASWSDYQNNRKGVLRTTDGGQTWEETPLEEDISYLEVDAAGRVFAGNVHDDAKRFRSSDQGETWEQFDLPDFWLTMLATYGENNLIVGLMNAGLFQSNDAGESWHPINDGFINSNVFTSVIDHQGHIFAGTAQRVWRSSDKGASWDNYGLNGVNGVGKLLVTPSGSLLAIVREGTLLRLYRSSSEKANWQAIDAFPPRDLAISPQGHIFGLEYDFEENGNLWRSTDDGETWQHVAEVPHARILMIHPNGDIFLGTELNRYLTRGIYRSSDEGQTWVQLTNGLTSTRNPNGLPEITSLIVDEASQIFAGTFGDGLFRSTDGGDTWQATSTDAKFIETMIVNGGKLFVSTRSQGIFATEDGGDTWVPVNDNLGNYWVPSLSVDDDGHLVAGTTGNGVFRTANPISVRVADRPRDALANAPRLQGYPNPFHTVTTLAFTLPAAMPVHLVVHDIMGRKVAVLLDEHRVSGYQTTTFHADALPGGIYLVTLSTPQGDFHEKVLLVK